MITTIEFGQFTTINYSSGYDGDGQLVYESSNASGPTETSYIVRSTALGGEVLTRLNQSGNKKITHVPAEGLLFATQQAVGGFVLQTYRNPLGTTETNKAVYDPLGNYIPFQAFADPRPPAGSYSSASMGALSGGLANPDAYGTGCMLDGLPTNCNLTSRMQNNGSAGQCPNNDCGPQARRARRQDRSLFSFLTTPYLAFGNNVSGYFLPGWTEVGTAQEQADAIRAWILGGQRTGIDSRPGETSNFLPQSTRVDEEKIKAAVNACFEEKFRMSVTHFSTAELYPRQEKEGSWHDGNINGGIARVEPLPRHANCHRLIVFSINANTDFIISASFAFSITCFAVTR